MNNLKATKRDNTSSGSINKLRASGFIPAILYGGKDPNAKISVEKKAVKNINKLTIKEKIEIIEKSKKNKDKKK